MIFFFSQLHAMVADDSCSSVLEQHTCFVEGLSSDGPEYVAMETNYQKKMETTLADENCFKVVMVHYEHVSICFPHSLCTISFPVVQRQKAHY